MRIAYITPYQGLELQQRRPVLSNLGLAANLKIELISELLTKRGHEVTIFSQGEVVERSVTYYPGFAGSTSSGSKVPVHYASALPIRFLNGLWSQTRTLRLFKQHHRLAPYDVVMIYNLKQPQVACADYARRQLRLPTIVEYEDDAFVDIGGKDEAGIKARLYLSFANKVLRAASGCIAVSPHLRSRFPDNIPGFLLRGVVDEQVLAAANRPLSFRKNWVVYSGTHFRSKGLVPLVNAWKALDVPGWELHIAGRGELTTELQRMAAGHGDIVFHGLLDRQENAELLGAAKIGINPHDVSTTPGNLFAFKIIEYLAAGNHVLTTPMGNLEPELERGITYMSDNTPAIIAETLRRVIRDRCYERNATKAAQDSYGPEAVASALDRLVNEVVGGNSVHNRRIQTGLRLASDGPSRTTPS